MSRAGLDAEADVCSVATSYPRRIRLMGMWTKRTKKPMKPITAQPIAVAVEILRNSAKTKEESQLNSA